MLESIDPKAARKRRCRRFRNTLIIIILLAAGAFAHSGNISVILQHYGMMLAVSDRYNARCYRRGFLLIYILSVVKLTAGIFAP